MLLLTQKSTLKLHRFEFTEQIHSAWKPHIEKPVHGKWCSLVMAERLEYERHDHLVPVIVHVNTVFVEVVKFQL